MRFLDLPPLARISAFLDSVDVGDCYVTGELEAYSCKLAGLDKKLSRSLDAEVATGSSPAELSKSPVGPLSDAGARRTLVYLILTLNAAYPDYDFGGLRARHFRRESGLAAVEDAVDAHLLEVARVWDATPGHGGGGSSADAPASAAADASSSAPAAGGGGDTPFFEALWRALDDAASLAECDVYSYRPDGSGSEPSGGEAVAAGAGKGLLSTSAPATATASAATAPLPPSSPSSRSRPRSVGRASDCYEGGDPFADDGALWSFNFFFHNRRLKRIVYFACRGVSKSAGSYEGDVGGFGRFPSSVGRGGGRRGDGLGGVGLGLGGGANDDGDGDDDDFYRDGGGFGEGRLSSAERYNSDGDDGDGGASYYLDPPVVVGSRGALPEYGGVELDDDEDVYGGRGSGRAGGASARRRRRRRQQTEEDEDDDEENAAAVAQVVAEALADDPAAVVAAIAPPVIVEGGGGGGGGGDGEDVAGEIDDL